MSNNLSANLEKAVKSEPTETESSQPLASDPAVEKHNIKRKDREKIVVLNQKLHSGQVWE
ncbi:hypothetical protein REPUB_Repub08aG0132400 [Reevesia pubescens]